MNQFNYLAVGVSAVVTYLLSSVWYLVLFRKPYTESLGKTAAELAKGPSILQASILQIVANIVMAIVLSWLMKQTHHQTVMQGMQLSVLVWLGFVAAVLGPMYAFQAYSFQFFCITSGAQLVSLLVMGAILGGWK